MPTSGHDTGHPRRKVLAAGAAVGLAALGGTGCGLLDRDRPPPPDPLEPLRAQAQQLATLHAAAIDREPSLAGRLTPLRDAHQTHVAELTGLIGRPPASAPPAALDPGATAAGSGPAATPAALTQLRAAEEAAAHDAVAACLAAPTDRAALVGSIAAARASHVEVLR